MTARSVLERGGKRSATPLSHGGRFPNWPACSPAPKRRRRCALPAQSKTFRRAGARDSSRPRGADFQSAVSQVSNLRRHRRSCARWNPPAPADWESAIQQVRNLRYSFALLGLLLSTLIPQLATTLHAQSVSIDWHTLDGGGGTSTGGVFSVSGTIGQPDAGAMSSGSFSLAGGFWSLFSAVQTPGAPLLSIRQDTNHIITIEWPRPADGWALERTAALGTTAAATVWTEWSPPYQTNATHIFLTTNAPPGHAFFRLRRP